VTGMWAGTREVVRVKAADTVRNVTDLDPRPAGLARQLAVTATDQPHISLGYAPVVRPVGVTTFTVKGRAYLSSSLTPLPNQSIWYCEGVLCGGDDPPLRWPFLPTGSVRTDGAGYYAIHVEARTHQEGRLDNHNLRWLLLGDFAAWTQEQARWGSTAVYTQRIADTPPGHFRLTAAVEATPVPLGTAVPVYGHSNAWTERVLTPVYLLRQISPNVWRAESSARVRESGRFTLIARPPTRGNHRYRALRPGVEREYVTTVTPTMLLGAY